MSSRRLGIVCLAATLAFLVVSEGWALSNGGMVRAAPGLHYVAPGGSCGGVSPCYGTIQAAVDAAQTGDEIRIAAGTYTGVNGQGGGSQVVYIAKSLTLRGGYSIPDWDAPDPGLNVTEIGAQTLGRAVYVTGADTVVTLEGMRLTYGDANGLGGHRPLPFQDDDAGGNLYVGQATVTLSDCRVVAGAAPSAGYGGGLYARDGDLTVLRTVFDGNEAGQGGAAFFYNTVTHIAGSTFQDNRTTATNGDGVAVKAVGGAFTLIDSTVQSNTAAQKAPYSGAVDVSANPFLIAGTVISGTVYSSGVDLSSTGTLRDSTIHGNQYGGVRIGDGNIVTMDNRET